MAAIAVTRSDLTAIELRAAAGREKDSAASRRMLALAMVFDGADRTSAAETCGMDRQTLRDWVHRYNATGLAGLRNRKSSGRPPKLTAAQKAVLVELVEKGPDPARHKVVRWRRCDLAGLSNTIYENYDDILEKACQAWMFFANDKEQVASITTRQW